MLAEPYYSSHLYWKPGGSPPADTLSDNPNVGRLSAHEYTQFIVGAYCESSHKRLGFMQWSVGREGSTIYQMYNPAGGTEMPPGFEGAITNYVNVETDAGNNMGGFQLK